MIEIKKGLDLPMTGAPKQAIESGNSVSTVAVVGYDYHGMKPTMAVKVGDRVKLGQVLFTDKKTPGVQYTAPGAGVVKEINRGARRVFQSLVVELDGDDQETFTSYSADQLAGLTREQVQENLVNSGLWTALRARPFSKVPALDAKPSSIFVTAIDTNPGAADPAVIIAEQGEAFTQGITVLSKLTEGQVHLCKAPGTNIPAGSAQVTEFGGVHPAGNAGTHIHYLDPVNADKCVFTVGYQDVIAIGKLFTSGQILTDRVVSISGPQVTNPRLVRSRVGANLTELLEGETKPGDNRWISGSVFGGRNATNKSFSYLGRYHTQVSVLLEDYDRQLLHYVRLGPDKFSVMNTWISKLSPKKMFDFTTSANGSQRCMLPLGNFEKIMPLDILPTQLLRALIVKDLDMAEKLGALELDEEDLALCTYVCTGKFEYGPILRANLTTIEAEG